MAIDYGNGVTTTTYDPTSSRLTRQHTVRDPSGVAVALQDLVHPSWPNRGPRALNAYNESFTWDAARNLQEHVNCVAANAAGICGRRCTCDTAYHAGPNKLAANPTRYHYPGKERDAEFGLHSHGARYLAPWLGRWISPDPSGFVDGVNVYGFVRGRPSAGWDAEGREERVPPDADAPTEGAGDPNGHPEPPVFSWPSDTRPADSIFLRFVGQPVPRLATQIPMEDARSGQAVPRWFVSTGRNDGIGSLNMDYYEVVISDIPVGFTNLSCAQAITDDFSEFFTMASTGGVLA